MSKASRLCLRWDSFETNDTAGEGAWPNSTITKECSQALKGNSFCTVLNLQDSLFISSVP